MPIRAGALAVCIALACVIVFGQEQLPGGPALPPEPPSRVIRRQFEEKQELFKSNFTAQERFTKWTSADGLLTIAEVNREVLEEDRKFLVDENLAKRHVLGQNPRAYKHHGVVSRAEIDHVISLALPRIKGSELFGGVKDKTIRNSLGSFTEWFKGTVTQDNITARIYRRLSVLSGVAPEQLDTMNVQWYREKGFYICHYDTLSHGAFGINTEEAQQIFAANGRFDFEDDRQITALMYLNTVKKGGETMFFRTDNPPQDELDRSVASHQRLQGFKTKKDFGDHCSSPLAFKVPPTEGDVLFFPGFLNHGRYDYSTYHCSCPVEVGEKWTAQVWIHTKYQSAHNDFYLLAYFDAITAHIPSPGFSYLGYRLRHLLMRPVLTPAMSRGSDEEQEEIMMDPSVLHSHILPAPSPLKYIAETGAFTISFHYVIDVFPAVRTPIIEIGDVFALGYDRFGFLDIKCRKHPQLHGTDGPSPSVTVDHVTTKMEYRTHVSPLTIGAAYELRMWKASSGSRDEWKYQIRVEADTVATGLVKNCFPALPASDALATTDGLPDEADVPTESFWNSANLRLYSRGRSELYGFRMVGYRASDSTSRLFIRNPVRRVSTREVDSDTMIFVEGMPDYYSSLDELFEDDMYAELIENPGAKSALATTDGSRPPSPRPTVAEFSLVPSFRAPNRTLALELSVLRKRVLEQAAAQNAINADGSRQNANNMGTYFYNEHIVSDVLKKSGALFGSVKETGPPTSLDEILKLDLDLKDNRQMLPTRPTKVSPDDDDADVFDRWEDGVGYEVVSVAEQVWT